MSLRVLLTQKCYITLGSVELEQRKVIVISYSIMTKVCTLRVVI